MVPLKFYNANLLAMRNLLKFLLLVGIVPVLLTLNSCKDDSPAVPEQTEFEMLTQYMAINDLDLPDILNGWVVAGSPTLVDQNDFSVPGYYVIDIRKAEDFALGHIKDAHNVPNLADLLAEADNAGGTPILMVCYTGQTAARATAALRLLGYEAKTLKWGMSAWNADFNSKWVANATDLTHANWVSGDVPPANQEFSLPKINTGEIDGAAILRARVQAMLTNSSWGVSKTTVLDNPENFFVNNKWPEAAWSSFGHVKGAFRIDEDLKIANLKYLDGSKQVVTYCYTGQTSTITSAWLEVLGYEAKSLMFGANGIVWTGLKNADDYKKFAWHGTGAASELNYGYYDADNEFIPPAP